MDELMKKVAKLEAIAEIQKLQGKYYRCLDSKLWDELGEVFAPKFHTAFSDGRLVFDHYNGEGGLRQYYEAQMNDSAMISQHNGHTPEITVADDLQTAKAKWYLHDYLIILGTDWGVRGTAIYDIEYAVVDGEWKITSIGYKRIYEENWSRKKPGEKHMVTENMFAPQAEHHGAVTLQGDTQLKK